MKVLFELFPLLLFFAAILAWDIFVATAVAMAATVVQVSWLLLRKSKVPPMLWASLGIILVFGGLTLYLQDRTFILWKPTVLYWLFAVVLAAGALMGRNLIRALLSQEIQLPDPVWSRLNWSWVGFFSALGLLNLYVAFSFSEKIWATFKVFGALGLMLVFVVLQALVLARHVGEEKHGSRGENP